MPTRFVVHQTPEFVGWLDNLKDRKAQIGIVARLRQAEGGNLGDWKSVDGDLKEMRLDFGPGYRLYFVRRRSVIIVLLNGGAKSSQARDIRRAMRLAIEYGNPN